MNKKRDREKKKIYINLKEFNNNNELRSPKEQKSE
jgi:hypothetical protein